MTQSRRKIVYIVDDEPDDIAFLEKALAQIGYSTRSFLHGAEFLDAIAQLSPGCVLLDLHMPEIDGLQLLEKISDRRESFPAVMLSGQSDIPNAVQAMKLGAVSFLEKSGESNQLAATISDAFAIAARLQSEGIEMRHARDSMERLTPRERQVLRLLLAGKPNKVVAHELGLSERTIEVHRSRMMGRLQISSFAELVRRAVKAGEDRHVESE